MVEATNLTPEQFIKEIRQWGAMSQSLIRVRMMRKGDLVYVRVTLPHNGETIQTAIREERFKRFDWMNLNVIAVPAVWEFGRTMSQPYEKINELEE